MLAVGLLTRTLLNRNSPRLGLWATLPALALACGLITTAATAQSTADRTFTDELYPILEAAQCALCHNDNGIASRTRLRFPEDGASAAEVTSFGLSLGRFVDRNTPEQSLLFRKPTNRLEHTGGERIRQGSGEERTLRAWIGHLAKLPGDRVDAAQQQRDELSRKPIGDIQIRRLTHEQYNNTVRDLLGDETRPASAFPKEDFVHGFTNQAEGQNIAPLLAEAYNRAAETMARIAFQTGDYRGLVPCRPAAADDASCRARFIRTFGRKAFRRSLTDNEFARYEALFRREAERANDFLAGARIIVEAMLQSPKFLFYARPSFDKVDPYQTAARLSYFLWNTMPDDALLDDAGSGALATPDGIEQAARRMLRDPRAREAMHGFLAQWMRFDRLESAVRDRPHLPRVQRRAGGLDARRDAAALRRRRLGGPQLHGRLSLRLQLLEHESRAALWRAGARLRVRPGGVLARDRARRPAGPSHLPGRDEQARRHVAHRTRQVHSRALPVPGGSAASAGT